MNLSIVRNAAAIFFGLLMAVNSLIKAESPISPPNKESNKAEVRFVKFATVPIYCGPNKELYTTGQLQRGESVEVYYRTKDGWCAIRPPEGSHGWMAADRVYLLPGGKIAEVVGESTPSWIGSENRESNERYRWQIELQPGQQVSVIGETEQAVDSDKKRLWYKILPPPGEFRWVRSEALAATPPTIRDADLVETSGTDSEVESVSEAEMDSPVQPAVALQTDSAGDSTTQPASLNEYPLGTEVVEAEMVQEAPQIGEYIEGEGVVVESGPALMPGQDGLPFDGETIIAEDGSIVESWEGMPMDANCPTCNQSGCTSCGAADGTGTVECWEQEAPPIRYRPLARILGMIGLSVVEGEPVIDPACTSQPGCRCPRCLQHPNELTPRHSGRFGHLPRPTRRFTQPLSLDSSERSEFMSGARSLLQSKSFDSSYSYNARNEDRDMQLGMDRPIGIERGIPRDKSSFSDEALRENLKGDDWAPRSLDISPAGSQTELMKFTTPELQSAMSELTRRVSEPMVTWEFGGLSSEARRWLEQSSDPIARGEARLLLERIDEFERLRVRSMSRPSNAVAYQPFEPSFSSVGQPPSFDRISVPAQTVGFQRPSQESYPARSATSSPAINDPGIVQRNTDGTPASDASGWLVEVFSAQPGQPEFALTDDNGALIAYVQPSPGMNLRRYLKQPIGVYGIKGYLPHLSARQIVAERIVRIR
jgi:hypothetical protein